MYPQFKQSGYEQDVVQDWQSAPQWRPEAMWPPQPQVYEPPPLAYRPLETSTQTPRRWRLALLALTATFAGGVYARPQLEKYIGSLPAKLSSLGAEAGRQIPQWLLPLPASDVVDNVPQGQTPEEFAGIVTTPLPSTLSGVSGAAADQPQVGESETAPEAAAGPRAALVSPLPQAKAPDLAVAAGTAAPAPDAVAPAAVQAAAAAAAVPPPAPAAAAPAKRVEFASLSTGDDKRRRHSSHRARFVAPVARLAVAAPTLKPVASPIRQPAPVAAAPRETSSETSRETPREAPREQAAPADSLDGLIARAMRPTEVAPPKPSDVQAEPKAVAASKQVLERHEIANVLKGFSSSVSACGADLPRPANADVTLTVDPAGAVSAVKVTGPLFATLTAGCIVRTLKAAAFPPSRGLTFPYRFTVRPGARSQSTARLDLKPERTTAVAPLGKAPASAAAHVMDRSSLPSLPTKVSVSDDPLAGLNSRSVEGKATPRGRSPRTR